jgi:hypothetical protein
VVVLSRHYTSLTDLKKVIEVFFTFLTILVHRAMIFHFKTILKCYVFLKDKDRVKIWPGWAKILNWPPFFDTKFKGKSSEFLIWSCDEVQEFGISVLNLLTHFLNTSPNLLIQAHNT